MAISKAPGFETTASMLCALVLGRIQMGIARASSDALPILASRLIRESLFAALRQEGHEFTEERFFSWFAGLETLSDGQRSTFRPPKALCQAILTEFRHSPWDELVTSSQHLQKAFLAPSDFNRGDDHEEAHTVIAEARALIGALGEADDALPFQPVGMLFTAAAQTARFAREERSLDLIGQRAIEREHAGNARWALDILAGEYLAPRHGLPAALPMPGLVTLPTAPADSLDLDPTEAAISEDAVLSALHDTLSRLDRWLSEAERASAVLGSQLQDRRSNGRARQLAGYLAGFGPLRGHQIQQLLGVSRTGVGVIMGALEESQLIVTHKSRNAAQVYRYAPSHFPAPPEPAPSSPFAASAEAIREYEESMRAIDEILSRSPNAQGSD